MLKPELQSMRVAGRMAEKRVGRWQLRHFEQSPEKTHLDELRINMNEPPERRALALARLIPPGVYMSLQRRMIRQEIIELVEEHVGDIEAFARTLGMSYEDTLDAVLPGERRWQTIMSDTPAELVGHEPTLSFFGNVLVTGLGLGCVVSGLLANPAVDRIDVIEIDPDVIELVAPYYADDERFHVWHASAINPNCVPADLRWDFAWHDIWTHIADRNLRAETAEHGISYDRLFSVWDERVDEQDAWALEEAIAMQRAEDEIRERRTAWYAELEVADLDRRVELLQNQVIWEKWPQLVGQDDPAIRAVLDPTGEFARHLRERLIREPEFMEGLKAIAQGAFDDDEPLGRPNEEASL